MSLPNCSYVLNYYALIEIQKIFEIPDLFSNFVNQRLATLYVVALLNSFSCLRCTDGSVG